mgnify:CR=1 FL=1
MSSSRFTRTDAIAALGMFTYASSIVLTPIILLRIAAELEFGLARGGGIEAVRAGFLMAILVASGLAARRFGKIRSLAAGALILSAGLFGYAAAPSYLVVLGAVVLVGLGGGVLEALLNPLIQDAHPEDSGRYLNLVNAFFSVGIVVTVLVLGDLLTRGVSWRLLTAGLGLVSAACGLGFLLLRHREPNPERDPAAHGVRGQVRRILSQRRFWLFAVAMFCGGGAEGAFTFWSASYAQLNLDALARGGAFATAAFSSGMVIGRLASGHFVKQNQLHVLIISSALLGVAASLGAWAVSGLAAFMLVVFAAGLTIACFWPSIQSHAADELQVDATMLFILLSVGGIPGFGLASWIMGIIAERSDLRTSLLVIPVLLAGLALVMLLSRRGAALRRIHS